MGTHVDHAVRVARHIQAGTLMGFAMYLRRAGHWIEDKSGFSRGSFKKMRDEGGGGGVGVDLVGAWDTGKGTVSKTNSRAASTEVAAAVVALETLIHYQTALAE